MQGLGNTFVVLRGPLELDTRQVVKLCEQYGPEQSDGLLVISPISDRRIEMKYWNSDGSVAEMCGNGLRCTTRFAVDNQLVQPGQFEVETGAGLLQVVWDGNDPNMIEVQVGKASAEPDPITLFDTELYEANVGNPHAVTFVSDIATAPVQELGPKIEAHEHFPKHTNVEFVEVQDVHTIKVRIWERGVGETLACGTGMVAAANVAAQRKAVELPVTVKVPGGEARVWLDEQGFSRMLGPAMLA